MKFDIKFTTLQYIQLSSLIVSILTIYGCIADKPGLIIGGIFGVFYFKLSEIAEKLH